MKFKVIISELLALMTVGMFVLYLRLYFKTSSKFIFFWECFWFIIIFFIVWYGFYKRLEEQELPTKEKVKK